ncbi:hypothetical protein LH23_13940 [Cedecea neteri]|uniref:Uncharacterized protein n=1 Tax=Cedecea neteri TaxID=158822 RepID=A0AAN0S522_9ENTR|nr:hypothetical protein LH23_13940 [Cedecea neteri]
MQRFAHGITLNVPINVSQVWADGDRIAIFYHRQARGVTYPASLKDLLARFWSYSCQIRLF